MEFKCHPYNGKFFFHHHHQQIIQIRKCHVCHVRHLLVEMETRKIDNWENLAKDEKERLRDSISGTHCRNMDWLDSTSTNACPPSSDTFMNYLRSLSLSLSLFLYLILYINPVLFMVLSFKGTPHHAQILFIKSFPLNFQWYTYYYYLD